MSKSREQEVVNKCWPPEQVLFDNKGRVQWLRLGVESQDAVIMATREACK